MRSQVFSEADLRRKAREIANRFADVDEGPIPDDDDLIFSELVSDPAAHVLSPEIDETERHWKARKLLEPLDEELEQGRIPTARLEFFEALFDVWVGDISGLAPRASPAAVKRQFLEARKLIRNIWKV